MLPMLKEKLNHSAAFKSRLRIVLGSVFIAFTHAVAAVSGPVPDIGVGRALQRWLRRGKRRHFSPPCWVGCREAHRFPGRLPSPG